MVSKCSVDGDTELEAKISRVYDEFGGDFGMDYPRIELSSGGKAPPRGNFDGYSCLHPRLTKDLHWPQ